MGSSGDDSHAPWWVYVIRCSDNTLYTGIARDVEKRLLQHGRATGAGAKYLRGRGPLQVVFSRQVAGRSVALRVECAIKRLSRSRKEELLENGGVFDLIVAKYTS